MQISPHDSNIGDKSTTDPPRYGIGNLLAAADMPSFYFGYGSNMWRKQMTQRCPDSNFIGIGRLDGWHWQINERGYANVVEMTPNAQTERQIPIQAQSGSSSAVWGLIYTISKDDEARLDINEGVPYAYTKEIHPVRLWSAKKSPESISLPEMTASATEAVDEEDRPTQIPLTPSSRKDEEISSSEVRDMLVYVDRNRVKNSEPNIPYVYRMNRAIEDAVTAGVPIDYLTKSLRKFISAEENQY